MRRFFTIFLLVFGVAAMSHSGAFAQVAPHNFTNTVDCEDCHLLNQWGGGGGTPPATHPYFLKSCDICHTNDTGANYSRNSAPYVQTHSSEVIGKNTYGNWTKDCWDCHGHRLDTAPLIQGAYSAYSVGGGLTTFTLGNYTVNDSEWSDPADWGAKTGFSNPERGLIFSVKYFDQAENADVTTDYEIVYATASSVTVKGEDITVPQGGDFEIFYGQMIRKLVDGQFAVNFSGNTTFAESDGQAGDIDQDGVSDDATPDGICQVCHTQTKYWRSDGTLTAHNDGKNCTFCHSHEDGFRPACNACHGEPPITNELGGPNGLTAQLQPTGSTTAGFHELHATASGYNYDCFNCHLGGMLNVCVCDDEIDLGFTMFGFTGVGAHYDGQTNVAYGANEGMTVSNNGSTTCSNIYCHSEGTAVSTRLFDPTTFPGTAIVSPAWDGSSVDADGNACNNCHAYPPAYNQDQPKVNSHLRHQQVGYGACGLCHYGTTRDGLSIADTTKHVNGSYNVAPSPTFVANSTTRTLNFNYTFDAGGGTCSSNLCHQYWGFTDPVRWGNSTLLANPNVQQGTGCGEVNFNIVVTGGYPAPTPPYSCYYEWGDGTITDWSTDCSATHTYAANGSYNVKWSIRDANLHALVGANGTIYKNTAVIADCPPPPPTGEPATTVTVDPADGHTVTLTVTAGELGINYIFVEWRDGYKESRTIYLSEGQTTTFTHTYANEATYQIKTKVRDYTYANTFLLDDVTTYNP